MSDEFLLRFFSVSSLFKARQYTPQEIEVTNKMQAPLFREELERRTGRILKAK